MLVTDVSVVGLGKLGVCLAASLGNAGYSVTGVDIDESVVESVQEGTAPVPEPKLEEYLSDPATDVDATTSMDAVGDSDVTFVVVNTPVNSENRYSLADVRSVCLSLGEVLGEKDDYHLVVITSTVFPTATETEIREFLENASGKTAGEDFGLCYSPEFIAIGDIIDGLENPDFFLIGEHTERAGDVLSGVYETMRGNDAPMVRMDPTSAEVAKMAINSHLTTKISFANTLAQICEGIGASADGVTDALFADNRVNSAYLSPGTRFGGPCFPRDNRAFSQLAADANAAAPLADATDAVNDRHTTWLADVVRGTVDPESQVAVLGLTYKPDTYIVEESQGMELARALADDYHLRCYDPMGLDQARSTLDVPVGYSDSVEDALADASAAVLTTPWETFLDETVYRGHDIDLFDPWGALDGSRLPVETTYHPIGRR